jgi:hypothetical protein
LQDIADYVVSGYLCIEQITGPGIVAVFGKRFSHDSAELAGY